MKKERVTRYRSTVDNQKGAPVSVGGRGQRGNGMKAIAIACCVMLCAIFAFMARSAALGKCATFDEPTALVSAWAQTHYLDFRLGPENPPLYKYFIGLGVGRDRIGIDRQSPGWKAMLTDMNGDGSFSVNALYHRPERDVDRLLDRARSMMIALAVALGAVIAWWAWRLGGPLAAFCFDPNMLAHAPLLKNDLPLALAFTALMGGVWLLGERATIARWAVVSIMLGAALTTKFSGVLGIPILAAALLARAATPAPWPWFGGSAATRLGRMGVAALLFGGALLFSYVVVWGVYGFRFEISSDPGHRFDPGAIARAVSVPKGGGDNAPRDLPAGSSPTGTSNQLLGPAQWVIRHRLLPEGWIAGFVFIQNWSRSAPAFLCGERSTNGWWYYFPLAMLFKTPTATLLGMGLAVGFVARRWVRRTVSGTQYLWESIAFCILPATYMCVAMDMHYDVGLRTIFPVYPFLFITLGVAAADCRRRRPKLAAAITLALMAGLIFETTSAYPDFIPFFNVCSGGSRGGLALLSDSNLDWGQDLPLLGEWENKHPDRPIILVYFGMADPAYYQIQYFKTGRLSNNPGAARIEQMHPVFAVSATVLQGTYLSPIDYAKVQLFREAEPFTTLGGSIYLFDGS
jgi:hypothetical protein